MIADLRADSVRWRQEQRQTGSRGSTNSPVSSTMSGFTVPDSSSDPYVGSRTYEEGSASRAHRRDANSPAIAEGPYGAPAAGQRAQDPRSRMGEQMMVDAPPPSNQRYQGQPPPRGYQPEPRDYPENSRDYSRQQPSGRPYQPDQVMSDYAPPVSAPYGQESMYAPTSFGQPAGGAPPGYVRQGEYYVPVSQAFSAPAPAPSRPDPYAAPGYGQPQPQYREAARDPREARDPRYGVQPEFQDPRNAYPSPAATVSSVNARDREPMMSPPQPRFASRDDYLECAANDSSQYGTGAPQYDQQYGQRKYHDSRPVGPPANAASPAAPSARSGYPQPDPGYPPTSSRDPGYGRERKPAAPSGERRRRH